MLRSHGGTTAGALLLAVVVLAASAWVLLRGHPSRTQAVQGSPVTRALPEDAHGQLAKLAAADSQESESLRTDGDPRLSSPLLKYMLRWDDLAVVLHARNHLIQRCMAPFGFDYPVSSLAEAKDHSRRAEVEGNGRLYGITDRTVARRYGYWPASAMSAPTDVPAKGEDYNLVLFGTTDPGRPQFGSAQSPGHIGGREVPGGGCSSSADRDLSLDPNVSLYGVARDVWIQGELKLRHSRAYQTVVADWVGCMRASGHRVTSPLDDQGDIRQLLDARAARAQQGDPNPVEGEVELALDDITCKNRMHLVARLDRHRSTIDQAAIRRHHDLLLADRVRLNELVRRAELILDEAS